MGFHTGEYIVQLPEMAVMGQRLDDLPVRL